MNVRAQKLTIAVLMQTALTPLGAIPALASQDTLEMDSPVLVGWISTHPKMVFCYTYITCIKATMFFIARLIAHIELI